jgi:hypothetical protein
MARERKKARPLFLELSAPDLKLHIEEDTADLAALRAALVRAACAATVGVDQRPGACGGLRGSLLMAARYEVRECGR